MKKKKLFVFVSGCYDVLHAGHVQFFKDARALGDHLTVCFASKEVLKLYKGRESALPDDNKAVLIGAIRYVDRAVSSSNVHSIFDFLDHLKRLKPDILAVTADDKHKREKRKLCRQLDVKFVVLPKKNPVTRVSTTDIRKGLGKKLARGE